FLIRCASGLILLKIRAAPSISCFLNLNKTAISSSFLKYNNTTIAANSKRKIPLPIYFSENCQIAVATNTTAKTILIFLFIISRKYFNFENVQHKQALANQFLKRMAL